MCVVEQTTTDTFKASKGHLYAQTRATVAETRQNLTRQPELWSLTNAAYQTSTGGSLALASLFSDPSTNQTSAWLALLLRRPHQVRADNSSRNCRWAKPLCSMIDEEACCMDDSRQRSIDELKESVPSIARQVALSKWATPRRLRPKEEVSVEVYYYFHSVSSLPSPHLIHPE